MGAVVHCQGEGRAFPGYSARNPRPQSPRPARREKESCLHREEASSVGALPGQGAEERRGTRSKTARAATNTQVSPARRPPTRPARSYLSPRAALPPGNLRRQGLLCLSADRRSAPVSAGARLQPGSRDLASPPPPPTGLRTLPTGCRFARTSPPARTFPKVRFWVTTLKEVTYFL